MQSQFQRGQAFQNMPNFLQLRNIEQQSFEYARNMGMLNLNNICSRCNIQMIEISWKTSHGINVGKFKCQNCQTKFSKLRGTIFEGMKTSFHLFFVILTYYLQDLSVKKTAKLIKQNFNDEKINQKKAIVKYFKLFRKIIHYNIQQYLINAQFFGQVEIDETMVFKYKKGYPFARPQHLQYWVVGFYSRDSGQYIIVPVINRSREVLLQHIQKYVLPGSTIYSDYWSGYFNLRTMPKQSYLRDLGYNHYGINHSQRFVNKFNRRIHTNTIERCWRSLKSFTKQQQPRKGIEMYISHFMFEGMIEENQRFNKVIEYIINLQIQR